MIHINLLGKEAEKKTKGLKSIEWPEFSVAASQTGIAGLFVVVLVAVAAAWWYQGSRLSTLRTELATVQAERSRLEDVAAQVQTMRNRTDLVRQKLDVIVQLKANQTGPVMLLDQVSRNMTDGLWLTRLQLEGDQVTIRGGSMSESAIAGFLENLQDSTSFANVRLRTLGDTGEQNNFLIRLTYRPAAARPAQSNSAPGGGGR